MILRQLGDVGSDGNLGKKKNLLRLILQQLGKAGGKILDRAVKTITRPRNVRMLGSRSDEGQVYNYRMR